MTQKHGMGCGVACVAFVLGITYDKTLRLFKDPSQAWQTGFMCRDLVFALKQRNRIYSFKHLKIKNDPVLTLPGTIIFLPHSNKFP